MDYIIYCHNHLPANAGVFGPLSVCVALSQADSDNIEIKPFVSELHNYPKGLYSLQKQHANEQTSQKIHEPGSAWLRDTDPFTSSFSELEQKKKEGKKRTFFVLLYLQECFYNTFVRYLLPGLVCLRVENSKLILHLKYFYFCLFFDVNFSFQASVKNFHMNFHQSFSVCLGSSGGSSVAGRPPVIHVRDEKTYVCLTLLDMRPPRSNTRCQ